MTKRERVLSTIFWLVVVLLIVWLFTLATKDYRGQSRRDRARATELATLYLDRVDWLTQEWDRCPEEGWACRETTTLTKEVERLNFELACLQENLVSKCEKALAAAQVRRRTQQAK